MKREIQVAPEGADFWTGQYSEPLKTGLDGPVVGLRQALHMAREWRRNGQSDGPVTIWMADGRYPLLFPLEFGAEDYGVAEFKAYPGARPVLDGGMRVDAWEQTTVNGKAAWCADVSAILAEFGPFRSLFVNGERRRRARFPSNDTFWIESVPQQTSALDANRVNSEILRGSSRFVAAAGDLDAVESWAGAEVVMLNRWINERMPVKQYDRASRMMEMTIPTRLFLRTEFEDQGKTIRYWIENVRAGLQEPGDWFLDAESYQLFYLPHADEVPETCEVVVPVAKQFIRIRGNVQDNVPAGGIRFEGIGFEYADWSLPSNLPVWWDPYEPAHTWRPRSSFRHFTEGNEGNPRVECGSSPQAAFNLPGVIQMEAARDVAVVNCRIEHIGFYGIGLGESCQAIRMVGNTIADMGGGGVVLDGIDPMGDPRRETGHCHITDNHIHGGGQVFLAACGVTAVHTVKNVIAHNEIHDMTYSGISCGWMWGLSESVSRMHWIHKNHIYDLGRRGGMSDMGGIYLLGPQPGTFIQGNYIHNVTSAAYGGWGIYPDEGSSFLTIENNVVSHTGSESLHEHMGRQNVIRNNIFALGGEGGARFSRAPRNRWHAFPPEGGMFIRNIVITHGAPCVRDMLTYQERNPYDFDLNIYYDRTQSPATFSVQLITYMPKPGGEWEMKGWSQRQAAGLDLTSMLADPMLMDIEAGDFTPSADSPALKVGFHPIDLSDVGPRTSTHLPQSRTPHR